MRVGALAFPKPREILSWLVSCPYPFTCEPHSVVTSFATRVLVNHTESVVTNLSTRVKPKCMTQSQSYNNCSEEYKSNEKAHY